MAGDIRVNILSGFNDKGVKDAAASLGKMGSKIGDITKRLLGGFGAWQAWDKGVGFIRNSTDAARDLERNLSGLTTIFGEATSEMKMFAESGVSFGQSTAEAAKASTFLGSVLKQSGFSIKENTMLTKELVILGADLAATYGYDVQEALTGMTAMFRGEYDPIEKFGVAIKQAQVNAEMAQQGLSKLTGQEKLHAQQLVRMKLLFAATSDAQGAFTRNGDTLFVSQQRLAATFTNLQAQLGGVLIGPMTALVQVMQELGAKVGPPLMTLFSVISGFFVTAAGSASGFADQIVGIINQMVILAEIAKPIGDVVMWVLSNFGAPLLTAILTFKVLHTVITGVGTAFTAFRIILAAVTAGQVAAAAATTATAAAETAAVAPTVALGAAFALTPWGAIAIAIALVVAGIAAIAVASTTSTAATDTATTSTYTMSGSMADASGNAITYGNSLQSVSNNMLMVSSTAEQAAKAVAGANNVFATKSTDYFASRREISGAGFKKKLTPQQEIEKMLKEMKNNTSKGMDSVAGAAGGKKGKVVDAFKDMIKKIKGELASLHDSLMGAFDITSMGKSGSTISRNMSKLMEKMRTFSGLIKDLRQKGLNADLLMQIVKAGPVAGLDAAKALAGNDALLNQANASYAEYGALATGVASEAVQAKYANQYNITVDGGVGSGATIGKAVVAAIQAYERQSGSNWRA